MTALLAPGPTRVVIGWRMIPPACLCKWDPWFKAGRGTWKRTYANPRCPVHRKPEVKP